MVAASDVTDCRQNGCSAILKVEANEERQENMPVAHAGTSEVAIFGRVLEPEEATLDVAAAKAILNLDFNQADKDRMHELLGKAKKGTLTGDEQVEIDNYERVGHMLSLMKSKARRSLKGGEGNGTSEVH
jgi:hypothetical protein